MRMARCAAFLALSMPTVATGTPGGTCTVASSASRPFSAPTANGTPITGRSVSEAAKPGSAAESPAPVMITFTPRALAPLIRSPVCSGCRCADDAWNSNVAPAAFRISNAGSMRGLSDSEPTTISTSGTSGSLQQGVILAAPHSLVARVADEPLHFGQRHAPRSPRGRNDVLFHHQGTEIV